MVAVAVGFFLVLPVIEGGYLFFFFPFCFQEMILEGRVIMASFLPSHSLNLGGLTEFPRPHS